MSADTDLAAIDYVAIDLSSALPFAMDADGQILTFDPEVDPHVRFLGGSGVGKTNALTTLAYAALVRGWDLHVIDIANATGPVGLSATFGFAAPYARSVAANMAGATATFEALDAEVHARQALLAAHGAASWNDLPASVRPTRVVLVIDALESFDTYSGLGTDAEREHLGYQITSLVRTGRPLGISIASSCWPYSPVTDYDDSFLAHVAAGSSTVWFPRLTTTLDGDRRLGFTTALAPFSPDALTGSFMWDSVCADGLWARAWREPRGSAGFAAELEARLGLGGSTLEWAGEPSWR